MNIDNENFIRPIGLQKIICLSNGIHNIDVQFFSNTDLYLCYSSKCQFLMNLSHIKIDYLIDEIVCARKINTYIGIN